MMTNYSDLKNRILNFAYNNNIPITGEFEIIGNCNFDCSMCYAKSHDPNLSTDEWLKIFDQAHENGMLYALLTGGEVFLRPDFLILYKHLYDLGVKITIYTNGSILPENVLEELSIRQPEMIAITLYGYNQISYHEFTKTDSFNKVMTNIDRIISKKLNLVLRTIPLPTIYENLDKVIEIAKEKNLHLGYFLYVSKVKEDVKRLDASQLIDFERRMKIAFPVKSNSEVVYRCGALKNGFFVNHKGYMQGCSMMPIPSRKIEGNFLEVFLDLQKQWQELLDKSPCTNCDINKSCFTCLARRFLEGNVFSCSSYLKDYAMRNNYE